MFAICSFPGPSIHQAGTVRKPATIEHLYLDFDGFFASVEQLRDPALRGRPVGVVPYEGGKRSIIIACSREAKARGVKNIMEVEAARQVCRDIILVPQKPNLYMRAHHALVAEIGAVLPVDQVKSIDELCCSLDVNHRQDPFDLAMRIKRAIRYNIGACITCSIGFAANRHLAKIAGATQKPDGLTVWKPEEMPGPLVRVPLDDIPGVGSRMLKRLHGMGISDTAGLLNLEPKHMRRIWRSVTGERLWYALHGYDIAAQPTKRSMYGHGRVLPPDGRSLDAARETARLLTIKAARRMRRDGWYCKAFALWVQFYGARQGKNYSWGELMTLPIVRDDQALLAAFNKQWAKMEESVRTYSPREPVAARVGVTLGELEPATARQLDWLTNDDAERQRWERIGDALDEVNAKFGRTVASIGPWKPSPNVGGKIAFTRIPTADDFL